MDIVQLYARGAGGWTLSEQVQPEGILLPDPPDFRREIEEALGSTRIVRSDLGTLAALAPIDDGRVIAAAMWVLSLAFVIVWEQVDTRRPAGAIVVMGAAQYDGKPSPVLRARVDASRSTDSCVIHSMRRVSSVSLSWKW